MKAADHKKLVTKAQTLRRQVAGLGEDDVWREFLGRHADGETSTRAMSERQLVAVIEALHRAGAPRMAAKANGRPRYAASPQVAKIRALWIALADAGVIRDRSERAMSAFVRRQTKQDIGALSPAAANTVIEGLKAMAARARAGVAVQ